VELDEHDSIDLMLPRSISGWTSGVKKYERVGSSFVHLGFKKVAVDVEN